MDVIIISCVLVAALAVGMAVYEGRRGFSGLANFYVTMAVVNITAATLYVIFG